MEMMIKGKKGMFFTVIAIILSVLFLSTVMVYERYGQIQDMEKVEFRVKALDGFVDAVNRDYERALYISGYRALLALDAHVEENGVFVDDAESALEELVLNGTIGGQESVLMDGHTLKDWTLKIRAISQDMDIEPSLEILSVDVSQKNNWYINFESELNLSLYDQRGVAGFSGVYNHSNNVPIEGFGDPLYIVESNGVVLRRVVRTNTTDWDSSGLLRFLEEGGYRASDSGPSYLMRFEGDTGESVYGIESMVDKNELVSLDVIGSEEYDVTNVDYLFWQGLLNGSKIHGVTDNGHSYFRLDDEHLDDYGVEGDVY